MACHEVLTNESKKGRNESEAVSIANSKTNKQPTKPKTQGTVSMSSTPHLFYEIRQIITA